MLKFSLTKCVSKLKENTILKINDKYKSLAKGNKSATWISLWGYFFIFLVGISYILFLPPWEGYDETAHYSYVRELVDQHRIPVAGSSRISADVIEYTQRAPMPYQTTKDLANSESITYRDWFDEDFIFRMNKGVGLPLQLNWQAQHPPLYYIFMMPVLNICDEIRVEEKLFFLRLASWIIACVGLWLAVHTVIQYCTHTCEKQIQQPVLMLGIGWPFIFPQIFPEFARMGNDCLVVLLASIVMAIWINIKTNIRLRGLFLIACILGLGCITKVSFLPVAIVVTIFSFHTLVKLHGWFKALLLSIIAFSPIPAIAGWWYLNQANVNGNALGLELFSKGNSYDISAGIAIEGFLKGGHAMLRSFIWSGSWSQAQPPLIALMPFYAFCLFFLWGIFRQKWNSMSHFAIATIAAVSCALFIYLLKNILVTGSWLGVPGWYLHSFAAAFLILFLRSNVYNHNFLWKKTVLNITILYGICFFLVILTLQLLMFIGLIGKDSVNSQYLLFPNNSAVTISEILRRCEITFNNPILAFITLFSGLSGFLIVYQRYVCRNS